MRKAELSDWLCPSVSFPQISLSCTTGSKWLELKAQSSWAWSVIYRIAPFSHRTGRWWSTATSSVWRSHCPSDAFFLASTSPCLADHEGLVHCNQLRTGLLVKLDAHLWGLFSSLPLGYLWEVVPCRHIPLIFTMLAWYAHFSLASFILIKDSIDYLKFSASKGFKCTTL